MTYSVSDAQLVEGVGESTKDAIGVGGAAPLGVAGDLV